MRFTIFAFTLLGLTAGALAADSNNAVNDPAPQTTNEQGLEGFDIFGNDPGCYWAGKAPSCNGKCSEGFKNCGTDSSGDGAKCWTGKKMYCCSGDCPA